MRLKKPLVHQQRRHLDEKLQAWRSVAQIARPRYGWLKAVRESVGLSTQQLGILLGIDNAGVLRIEKREKEGRVSLETLGRAAEAMGCTLIYAIVPQESLEQIVNEKSLTAASTIMGTVSHTMKLEKQGVKEHATQMQLEELARELKSRLDPALWEKK